MKKVIFATVISFVLLSCTTQSVKPLDKNMFVGNWLEALPSDTQYIQGFTLAEDGKANSIGTETLLYKSWMLENQNFVCSVESIGNGISFERLDTMVVEKIGTDSLVFKRGDSVVEYLKYNVRNFNGLLPAASCPGIEYNLTLYNRPTHSDGYFKLVMKYLQAEDGKDSYFTYIGKQFTLRGDATDKNAVVYQLIPFGDNKDEIMNFLSQGETLTLLNKDFERAESGLNYDLKEVK